MVKDPLLSVIIPVYNVQDYLEECLDSIINQTYSNLEIICVNDGSTDNSLSILKRYEQKDSRIIVLDKKNEGQAIARNAAIEIAKGNYITFVDSDDVIQSDTYKKNLSIFMEDDDIEMIQYPTCVAWRSEKEYLRNPQSKIIEGSLNVFTSIWQNNPLSYSFCDKIFKMNIFKDIRFPNGQIYEDQYLAAIIGQRINKCYISQDGLYFYRFRPESTTTKRFDYKKNHDLVLAFLEAYKGSLGNPFISDVDSLLFLLRNVYWFMVHYFRDYSEEEQNNMVEILNGYPIQLKPFLKTLFSSKSSFKDKYHLTLLYCLGLRNTHKLFSYIENRKK